MASRPVLEVERADRGYDKPAARKQRWKEFVKPLPAPVLQCPARAAWIAASRLP